MTRLLLINADGPEARVALLEGGAVAEVQMERPGERGVAGNIYKGRVLRVLPGMQAAFVDIGLGRAGFLYAGPAEGQEDADEPAAAAFPRPREGQELLVQVARGPIGSKGPRLTAAISLPGRRLVHLPRVDRVGVSRRIASEEERERLRDLVERTRPAGQGFIARTAAEGLGEEALRAEMDFLVRLWQGIAERAERVRAPLLLHHDLDLPLRAVRDLLTRDVDRVLVDDLDTYRRVRDFTATFQPALAERVTLYRDREPLFDRHGVEIEIDAALDRRVWLKSGGYLVLDQGEALTAIDVNSGRFVGRRNLEDTATKTNLEAVREIAHQLRLRDLGGIIVVDFIDMMEEANRDKVWRALEQALAGDRVRCTLHPFSSELGLVEITRKRVRESLGRRLTVPCPHCEGRGRVKAALTVCYDVIREIRRRVAGLPGELVTVRAHPDVADLLADAERDQVEALERRFGRTVRVEPRPGFHVEQFEIHVKMG